jgi:hypothetical protein
VPPVTVVVIVVVDLPLNALSHRLSFSLYLIPSFLDYIFAPFFATPKYHLEKKESNTNGKGKKK